MTRLLSCDIRGLDLTAWSWSGNRVGGEFSRVRREDFAADQQHTAEEINVTLREATLLPGKGVASQLLHHVVGLDLQVHTDRQTLPYTAALPVRQ